MDAFNLTHHLIQYAAMIRNKLEEGLFCRTCRKMPQDPATGLCGHTRCRSCMIQEPQCTCGIVTASESVMRNIKVENIIRQIYDKYSTSYFIFVTPDAQPSTSSEPEQQQPHPGSSQGREVTRRSEGKIKFFRTKLFPLERLLTGLWLLINGSMFEAIGQWTFACLSRKGASLKSLQALEWAVHKYVNTTSIEQLQMLKNIIEKLNYFNMGVNQGDVECSVCLERLRLPVTTSCGHTFCKRCLIGSIAIRRVCPLCRNHLDRDKFEIDDFLYRFLGFGQYDDSTLPLPMPTSSDNEYITSMNSVLRRLPRSYRPLMVRLLTNVGRIHITTNDGHRRRAEADENDVRVATID